MNGWSLDQVRSLTTSEYDALNELVEELTKQPPED